MRNLLFLLYLSNERFPAKLACTIQQMVMCEAFAKSGISVQLVFPRYHDMPACSVQQLYKFYGVDACFEIKRLFSLLCLSKPLVDGAKHLHIPFIGGLSLLASTWIFALKLLATGKLEKPTVIYSRNVIGAYVFFKLKRWVTCRKKFKIFFEVHSLDQQYPRRFFHKLLRESDGLICITRALKTALVSKYGVSPEKILVAPDGVRKSLLDLPVISQIIARQQLNITAAKVVLYTGQILPGKGAEVFVEAAAFFKDVTFILVGGHGNFLLRLQQKAQEQKLTNILFTGFVPPVRAPLFQAAADVLVLPPTADHDTSAFTSPLKLFEYMAARRPIVASNLPVLGEILQDRHNALFFKAGDAADLAAKIKLVLTDARLADMLSANAWELVQRYTWEERAKRIVEFFQCGTVE